ncbi:MAG: phosphatase, partial [Betaproteobacteria bacterium]|nr:phosphatase [Betaproteobacteria bacterium]
EFKALGGAAIEVVTGSHESRQIPEFATYARDFDLAASRGADYHGPGESRFEPGTMAPLPAGLTPVWEMF